MTDPNIQEVAKAAAESAKFGTQAVKTSEKILTFAARVFKEPAYEVSGMIGDRLKLFRWERQVAYADKVNKLLDERGVSETRAVPPKFALPILEGATLEEDDELQKVWAKLMANAMDPSFKVDLRMSFVEIIKSLNALDIRFLNMFYRSLQQNKTTDWNNLWNHNAKKENVLRILKINSEEYEISAYNLFRTQCLAPVIMRGGVKIGNEPITIYKGTSAVVLTPLGADFVRACIE